MRMLNPIYDTSFKYLMEDIGLAKTFIGTIIGKEIVSLEPRPQEVTTPREPSEEAVKEGKNEPKNTVQRFDYVAKIDLGNGEEVISGIELQKLRKAMDLVRFRGYLATLYNDKNLTLKDNPNIPLPLYTIYLLGEGYIVD